MVYGLSDGDPTRHSAIRKMSVYSLFEWDSLRKWVAYDKYLNGNG